MLKKERFISGLTCEECTCILSLVLKGWIFQLRLLQNVSKFKVLQEDGICPLNHFMRVSLS